MANTRRCVHIDARDVLAWLAGQGGPVDIGAVTEGVDALDRLMLSLALGALAQLGYVAIEKPGHNQAWLYTLTELGRNYERPAD